MAMKRLTQAAVLAVALAASAPAFAVMATWTGKQEQVQTVSGKFAWRCEYMYAGQYYYLLFETSCPSSVELE
jgi:hypothetical protein